jgi:hypothetical protein
MISSLLPKSTRKSGWAVIDPLGDRPHRELVGSMLGDNLPGSIQNSLLCAFLAALTWFLHKWLLT